LGKCISERCGSTTNLWPGDGHGNSSVTPETRSSALRSPRHAVRRAVCGQRQRLKRNPTSHVAYRERGDERRWSRRHEWPHSSRQCSFTGQSATPQGTLLQVTCGEAEANHQRFIRGGQNSARERTGHPSFAWHRQPIPVFILSPAEQSGVAGSCLTSATALQILPIL
jgi:hypothetical protein